MAQTIITQMLEYCKEKGITAKTLLTKNDELSEKTVGNFFAGKMDDCRASTLVSIARSIGLQIVITADGETPLDKASYESQLSAKDGTISELVEHNAELVSTIATLREENKASTVEAEKKDIESKWLRRCLRVCGIILAVVLLLCVGIVIADILNHDVGWVRATVQQLSQENVLHQSAVRI